MSTAPGGGRVIWNSIRWRAALLTSSLVALVLAAFTWHVFSELQRDLLERAGDRAQNTATILAGQTSGSVQLGLNRFQELAKDPAVRDFLGRPNDGTRTGAVDRIRRFAAPESDQVIEVWSASGQRLVREAHPADSTTPFPTRPAPAGVGLNPFEVSDGRLFTRLIADITIDGTSGSEPLGSMQLVRLVKPTPSATVNGIVGGGATVLIGNQSGHVWTNLEGLVDDPHFNFSNPAAQEFRGPHGETLIGASARIAGTPWSVLIELPRNVVVAPAWQLLRRLTAASLALLILTMIVAVALSRQVTKPLDELTAAVRDVARGNYASRVVTDRQDEVGRLGQAFNVMAAQIEQGRAALEARAAELSAAREAADRANTVKDDFLAVLSHELRTPLNAMLGWCQMLRSGIVPEGKRAHALEVIERNAQSQLRLVEDLLDVSRIAAGKFVVDLQRIDPAGVLQAAIESIQPVAADHGITIRADIATDIGAVEGDAGRLQQALWNLLSNAIKFTPRGGTVTASARRIDGNVELVIHDDGPGIPEDVLPRIFNRLEQGDSTRTRHHSGMGLGLTIAQQVIQLHRGSIHAASVPGHGATFRILIPVFQEADGLGLHSVRPRAFQSPSIQGLEILVVEDSDDDRELLTELLRRHGASVAAVASAEEGLVWLDGHSTDLIVSDIRMPRQDGFEFIRRVRADARQSFARVPAIALTANASAEKREQSQLAGFDAHLNKPIEISELLTTIASVVGARDSAKTS